MTLDEIAKELGVSKSTVSRALSGKGRIGEETRDRIKTYARETGFWTGQKKEEVSGTNNIGVVIPADAYTTSIPFFQECLLGICEAASLLQYDVLITRGMMNDISGIQQLVEKKKVDGIILTRSMEEDRALKYLTEIHFPTGLTGLCKYDEVIQVDTDNQEATESLTSMLIGRGYRKFALIAGDLSYKVNRGRRKGFESAIEKHGLDKEQQVYHMGFLNTDLVDNVLSEILAKRVECIICGDDVICTRIMSGLQAEGYRIPLDISIVSLYNSTNLDCFSPAVTAVNISAKQVGNMIGKQMINYLRGKEYSAKTMLDYEILFRKSADKVYRV